MPDPDRTDSDSIESPQPTAAEASMGAPPRPLNRYGIGLLTLLQLLAVLCILFVGNYLAANYYRSYDLSRDGDYTLAPSTLRYLESPTVQDHRPVKWTLAYRRSSPFYERIRALAERFANASDGKIELEVVDPMRSKERTEQVMAAYDLTMVRDMLIIDARPDDSPVIQESADGNRSLNPNIKLLLGEEMVIYKADADGNRRPNAFQGEELMIMRLVAAIEGRPRQILFLADKSQLDDQGERSPARILEDSMRLQNIEFTHTALATLADIPPSVAGVALVAPKYDLTENELAVLERYWEQPRAAIMVLLKAGEAPPRLRAFLRARGVTPRRDRIVKKDGNRTISTVDATFTKGIGFLTDLAGKSTLFDGATSSLEVREEDPLLVDLRLFPLPLIEATAGFWGETKFGDGSETFDRLEDNGPPLALAASIERGAAASDELAATTGRMVIVANTDFLDPERQRAENMDFLASATNWLVGREELAGITPRTLGTYKLPILDDHVSFINRVNLFFMPGFLLLLGAFVWSARRA